jgi:hypothetical protein
MDAGAGAPYPTDYERLSSSAIRLVGASPWTRRLFGRWLFEDEPPAAALTTGSLHRRFLALPGAYRSPTN